MRRFRSTFGTGTICTGTALVFLLLAGCHGGGGEARTADPGYDPERRLTELGLVLPEPNKPIANFVPAVRTGNLVFLSGHLPCGGLEPGESGRVGRERTVEEGRAAAREVALCLLASLKAEIGDLRRVRRIVRVFGMIYAAEEFTRHPEVINGCSDLLVEVFGERGRHARAAVGMASLPRGSSVEIEMLVEIEPE